MWRSPLGRWSRWAYRRSWTGLSAPLDTTGAQLGVDSGIWLASIVTEGDHRKVSVETSLKGMQHTLSALTAQGIEPLDFRDDRLSHLLTHLSSQPLGTRSNAT